MARRMTEVEVLRLRMVIALFGRKKEEVARAADITGPRLNDYLSGRRTISEARLARLFRVACGGEIAEVEGGDHERAIA